MKHRNKVGIILQARLGSRRFPQKVVKKLGDHVLLDFLIKRLKKCSKVDQIILATTNSKQDESLKQLSDKNNISFYAGASEDVLGRYSSAAKEFNLDIIIRITGDCPFSDPELIDAAVKEFIENDYQYLANNKPPTFPDGLDIEIFTIEHLNELDRRTILLSDREHVTSLSKTITTNTMNISNSVDLSAIRWTVDEECDLELLNLLIKDIRDPLDISWEELHNIYKHDNNIGEINSHLKRNEGSDLSTGEKLWRHAKTVIPGGNMLLSKRAEMYTLNKWPSYFSAAKGCKVWDLDQNEFLDLGLMGVGTNILGYSNDEVNESVFEAIHKGTMSSLNCPEEPQLVDKLIKINPWSGIVKLARSGGEANSIAVRIARAYTGNDHIAICGYHGWHDWYLSANLKSSDLLNNHLLTGLDPIGVPQALKDTVHPFDYNDIDQLEAIVKTHKLAAVKMEVERNKPPSNKFLNKVRSLCNRFNIPLIFDECTSGFRETLGGLHLKYGVNPDIAIYGKALGNGYAITAVVCKKEFLKTTESSFISSTFWTERIGPSAAIKTLEIMERDHSYTYISELGDYIKDGWKRIANRNNLPISITGLRSMPAFNLGFENSHYYKTLITDRLLSRNMIATNSIYVSTSHTKEIIDSYLDELDTIFTEISVDPDPTRILSLIHQNPCKITFKRLN